MHKETRSHFAPTSSRALCMHAIFICLTISVSDWERKALSSTLFPVRPSSIKLWINKYYLPSLCIQPCMRIRVCVCVEVCITDIQYGSIAVVASRWEQVVVIFLAVRVPIALKEVPRANLVLTVGAHEVLGVPRSAHGSHHLVWGDTVHEKLMSCKEKRPGSAEKISAAEHESSKGNPANSSRCLQLKV